MMNRFLGMLALVLVTSSCFAASGSWAPGLSGLQNGSLPGPGYYLSDSFYFYTSHEFKDRRGDKVNDILGTPVKLKVDIESNLTTFLWVSPYNVLGATYSANVTGTFGHVKGDLSLGEVFNDTASKFNVMDTYVEPINFSWHLKRFDIFTSYGFFAPTGNYDKNDAANTGRDRWTHQLNAGVTAYLDEKKSWSIALTPRYEIHMGQQSKDARDGDNLTLEWGIGKQFVFMNCDKTAPTGIFTIGPVGYAQWQTTHNTGPEAIQRDTLAKVYAAGLEAKYTKISWKAATFGVRVNKEFEASGRTQGTMGMFNFGIKF